MVLSFPFSLNVLHNNVHKIFLNQASPTLKNKEVIHKNPTPFLFLFVAFMKFDFWAQKEIE